MKINTNKADFLGAFPAFFMGALAYMENSFFVIFLTNYAMLSTKGMGTVTSLGSTLIAFASLISGVLMQKINFKSGKYRPWLIPMGILIIIGRYMQFTKINASENVLVIWFMAGYLISNFAFSFTTTSHGALCGAMATEPEHRVQMGAWKMGFGRLMQLLFSLVAVNMIAALGGDNPARGYSIVGTGNAVLHFIGCLMLFIVTKNVNDAARDAKGEVKENARVSIWEMIKYSIFNKCTILFMLASWFKVGSNMVLAMTMAYYYTYIGGDMSLFTVYLTATSFVAIAGSVITPFLCKLFKGTRNTYSGGMLVYGLFLLAAFFLKGNVLVVTILAVCAQLFWGVYMSAEQPLFLAVIDYTENKTGKDLRAFMLGLNTFCIKVGNIIATTTIAVALGAIGFEAANVTAAALKGLPFVVLGIPAIYAFISCTSSRLLPLPDDEIRRLRQEIEARQAEAE